MDMLMRVLAREWGTEGVSANCITPGPTDDTEGMRRLAPTEEMRQVVLKNVPLRRYGTKDEPKFLKDEYDALAKPASGAKIICAALVRKGLLTGEPKWEDKFQGGEAGPQG